MNTQITRVFGLIVFLFALLIIWTTRWTVIDAKSLRNNPLNDRTLVQELRIKRGRILADDGTVLARSVRQGGGTWGRTYPTGSEFAQVIGYSLPRQGRAAGLELSRGEELRGIQTGLSSVFGPLTSNRVGDDVDTSLDPKAQQVAIQELAGRAGSVVALNPQTGAVLVMYANPVYNDNHPNAVGPNISYLNRSTQGQYPPGSTFKVVTATAAIDSGKFTPNSVVNGNSPKTISGVPLNNDNNQSFGPISLTTALTYSVNTVWAQVAESVGRATMTKYMKRFGFYSKPPLDYPPDEMAESRPFSPTGRPYPPASPNEDIGRIGDRAGRAVGHPAADGARRGGGREQGGADGPPLHVARRQPGRPDGRDGASDRLAHRDEAIDRGRGHPDDEAGRRGGHRHPGPARQHQRRGQDRHGVDRPPRLEPDPAVVHRLRAGERPARSPSRSRSRRPRAASAAPWPRRSPRT